MAWVDLGIPVQGWTKEWTLGCVNAICRIPLATGKKEVPQPRGYSFAQSSTYATHRYGVSRTHLPSTAPDASRHLVVLLSARVRQGAFSKSHSIPQLRPASSLKWPIMLQSKSLYWLCKCLTHGLAESHPPKEGEGAIVSFAYLHLQKPWRLTSSLCTN